MKLVIANFKSHKTQQEIALWISDFLSKTKELDLSNVKIVLALPFPYLSELKPDNQTLSLAAQDVSPFPEGSYTGAVNAVQLHDLGVSFCLVGHSERRKYFHETSVEVASKVKELLASGITPIVCVSQADLSSQFASLEASEREACYFANETLADIGGTTTTPIEEIIETSKQISAYTDKSHLGTIYGGSVTEHNVESVIDNVDGVLVASASLDVDSFFAVVEKVIRHA